MSGDEAKCFMKSWDCSTSGNIQKVGCIVSCRDNASIGSDEDKSNDENEEDLREIISIDRLIIADWTWSFVNEQETMRVYLPKVNFNSEDLYY